MMVTINPARGSVDHDRMPPSAALPDTAWLLIGAVIAFVALAVVYAFAIMARNEIYLHDLRIEVNQIRTRRIKELRRLHGLEDFEPDVDIIEVGEPANPLAAAQVPAPASKAA